MKLKDVLLNVLLGLGIFAFLVIMASLDSLPFWALAALALVVWAGYILLVVRDFLREQRQQPQFFVRTGDGNLVPLNQATEARKRAEIYDQEEDN